MSRLTLLHPDDWHLHLRDAAAMTSVVAHSARQFARAIVMPNLKPPITTVDAALACRERILQALPEEADFEPLMTLYLTEATSVAEVEKAASDPHIHAFKLYPAGATTKSDAAWAVWSGFIPCWSDGKIRHAPAGTWRSGGSRHRHLRPQGGILDGNGAYRQCFAGLRVVLEHVTTADAVRFMRESGPNVAATLTAHHLLYNRNALLVGGIRPHFYCLPVLKRESHRQALVEAATGGEAKFFLGTDSAPHPQNQKESACGCAGCYTAYAAIELYAKPSRPSTSWRIYQVRQPQRPGFLPAASRTKASSR